MINQSALSAATAPASKALAPFPRPGFRVERDPEHGFEASRDRILLTLLALDLMLMAFFVVMNSASTFDAKRSAQVVEGLAPAAQAATSPDTQPEAKPEAGSGTRAAASAELRAAVADVLQAFLPQGAGVTAAPDDGRVDVDMPGALADTGSLPADVISGLADVLGNPPSGYRTELLIRAQDNPERLGHVARDLAAAGVDPDLISVGAISTGLPAKGQGPLRFTFMLLDPGAETRVPTAAGLRP